MGFEVKSYNPFDPIQDTESDLRVPPGDVEAHVTTHSIRYRILKDRFHHTILDSFKCYNPFDPIQDTERRDREGQGVLPAQLQPIRSDTGY